MYIPISAILFSLALSSVQSWLMHLRFNSLTGWLWLGVNTIGLAIAFVIAVGSLYPLVRIFRLDVLQNGTHGSIAMVAAIAIFTVVMIALQWSVLRRQVKASLLQAGLKCRRWRWSLVLPDDAIPHRPCWQYFLTFIVYVFSIGHIRWCGTGKSSHLTKEWKLNKLYICGMGILLVRADETPTPQVISGIDSRGASGNRLSALNVLSESERESYSNGVRS